MRSTRASPIDCSRRVLSRVRQRRRSRRTFAGVSAGRAVQSGSSLTIATRTSGVESPAPTYVIEGERSAEREEFEVFVDSFDWGSVEREAVFVAHCQGKGCNSALIRHWSDTK